MFRNREIRRFSALFAAIAAVSAAAGFALGRESGLLALISAAAFGAAFFAFTAARYRSIERVSEQIDHVLHDTDAVYISESEEGELSILKSEITKMTVRIREQNDALKREKGYLADSLADIAHQLRTPLTSANLILPLVRDSADEQERKALLRETQELLAQMEWLLNSLLKLSRLDAGIVVFNRGKLDAASLLRAAVRPLLIPMELHHIGLRIHVPEGVTLFGDMGWLSEAIQNIIKNCMESAGDGGWIDIACEDNALFTEITIRDSGAGFDKEDIPHLFERFYRGRKDGALGYGIGLALCKTIILRHGGTLAARNHPQGGAMFVIRFPK